MKLQLGFSTCPNDTFMFDALVHHKIDTYGLEFEVFMADVEELNKKAFEKSIDITKLSYHAYSYITDYYSILNAGSALGKNNGPLLISSKEFKNDQIDSLKIAIPGKFTTANLLLKIAFPNATNKIEYLFSDIENAILIKDVDAGLIIHENRFTYEKNGFRKIIDLGEFWEETTKQLTNTDEGLPIPLGGIVINRKLPIDIQHRFNKALQNSIEFAFNNPQSSIDYIKKHAQEMDEDIVRKHIKLYVNEYSKSLGFKGKHAIKTLYSKAEEYGVIPKISEEIFLD